MEFIGGYNWRWLWSNKYEIDYITIASTGDAQDFGDLIKQEIHFQVVGHQLEDCLQEEVQYYK